MNVIGLDTSNYTTSIAVFNGNDGTNCSQLLPVKEGSLGLRQSDAVFHHTKSLPELSDRLFSNIKEKKFSAVGVSTRPRAVEGSYMPCFMVGYSHGKLLSDALGIPLYTFSHQQGHIAAALWSAGRMDLMEKPHLAWHLSGGTTELLLVEPENFQPKCTKIGGTTDISAGQLIDRTGQLLSLPFPSGKHIDTLSQNAERTDLFRVKCADMFSSLPGVENKMREYFSKCGSDCETSAYVLRSVADAICQATKQALSAYPGLPVVFSGGVASNSMLRKLTESFDPIFAQPQYSTDNAMGVAILTYFSTEVNMTAKVLTVTQITEYIRVTLDRDELLSSVAVKGEISNYKLYPSGHHYFTLKDENSAIKCVMFRANGIRLRFRPENGMKIIALGRVSVFPRDGVYQLYCTSLTPDGAGDLHVAFEQLKKKLSEEGLFDPGFKKPIPRYPGTIAIITSSAGAAIHDMLRILRKRYPLAKVKLLPVRVQGQEAPGEIVDAIRFVNANKIADLIITGRGGGSIEDLWSFNDEAVARAIFASEIPIISAVGHEPDVTISDYVADLRAATPSNAAELAVPDQQTLYQNLDNLYRSIYHSFSGQLKAYRRHFKILRANALLQDPTQYIEKHRQDLSLMHDRLNMCYQQKLHLKKQQFIGLTAKLDAMSPLKVLKRGYSIVTDQNEKLLRSVNQIHEQDELRISVSDGTVLARALEVRENDL